MNLSVRPAEPTDTACAYRLICELENMEMDWDKFREYYALNIGDSRNYYLVAEVDAKVIGLLHCYGQRLLHHLNMVYEIQELYVDKAYRSKGVGQALLRSLRTWLEDRDYDVLEVSSNIRRKGAHTFYERNGFVNTHLKFIQPRRP